MDNWSTVEENIDLAADSTGTLNTQQEIYMDSLQAHFETLGAAVENLQSALIDNEFEDIIKLLSDGLTAGVNGIATVVKSLGGLSGAVPAITALFTSMGSEAIVKALSNDVIKAQQLSELSTEIGEKQKFIEQLKENSSKGIGSYGQEGQEVYTKQLDTLELVYQNIGKIGPEMAAAIGGVVDKVGQVNAAYEEQKATIQEINSTYGTNLNMDDYSSRTQLVDALKEKLEGVASVSLKNNQVIVQPLKSLREEAEVVNDELQRTISQYEQLLIAQNKGNSNSTQSSNVANSLMGSIDFIESMAGLTESAQGKLAALKNEMLKLCNAAEPTGEAFKQLTKEALEQGLSNEETAKKLQNYINKLQDFVNVKNKRIGNGGKITVKADVEQAKQELDNVQGTVRNLNNTEAKIKVISDVSSALMGLNSLYTA